MVQNTAVIAEMSSNLERPTTNDQRPISLSRNGRAFQRLAAVVTQGHIHEYVSAGGIETHNQGFGIFTTPASLLRSMLGRRTNMEVKSLIVERSNSVANDLVGQLADGLANQLFVGLGHFNAG